LCRTFYFAFLFAPYDAADALLLTEHYGYFIIYNVYKLTKYYYLESNKKNKNLFLLFQNGISLIRIVEIINEVLLTK